MHKHIYRLFHTVAGVKRLIVVLVMDAEATHAQLVAEAHKRYGITRDLTEVADVEHTSIVLKRSAA